MNQMNRGTASLIYFTILIAAVLLLTACSSESVPATATPSTTVETEATSSAEEAVSSTESEESDTQIVVTPTLAPTPTPGPVDNLVTELIEDTIIADFSFLGLTSENWINLAISLLVILLGYVVAGWLIGVGLRWLVRRRRCRGCRACHDRCRRARNFCNRGHRHDFRIRGDRLRWPNLKPRRP